MACLLSQLSISVLCITHRQNKCLAIANREFHKRLDRNGLNVQRKRMPGADRNAGGTRGIVVNWTTDHEQLDVIIEQHFDSKDKVLISNK